MKQLLIDLGRLPAHWLSLLLLTVYLLTYAGVTHSVDEIATLTVTESLLVEQRWHTNQMAWDQARTPPQNAPGIDGNLYSKKGLGVSLLALPFFALHNRGLNLGAVQLALLANSLLTAATVYLFHRLIVTLNFSTTTAASGALALGLATPLWPYARTLFSESLAACGLCLALLGLFSYRVYLRKAESTHRATVALCWTGCGLAILIFARSANAILLAPFLSYLVYVRQQEQPDRPRLLLYSYEWLALALPVGGALLLTMVYNHLRFNTWFTFPQAAFETFSTPLFTGLTGLLISPGKGILWYMPLLFLLFWGGPRWWRGARFPDYGLAATLSAITLLFYAKWYDWTGGRAWGPRLLVMIIPALVILCLPALDRLRQPQGAARWWIGGLLMLSFVVQVPGVLLNFEQLEAGQMQAGLTFDQLVWTLSCTPLLTYWPAFITTRWLDPVWGHAFFWQQGWVQSGWFVITGSVLLLTLGVGVQRTIRGQATYALWGLSLSFALLFAFVTVYIAQADPRWAERTADPADNRAVVDYLAQQAQPGDVVLLDMTATTDQQGRQGFWMNDGGSNLPYIAWVRNNAVLSLDKQLAVWLRPYRRIWLVMQETVENAPDSTTEQWLDQQAYRGRQQWLGSQRVVEYLAATVHEPLAALSTPVAFGDVAVLESYQLQIGDASPYAHLALTWQTKPTAEWRFSVQALEGDGQVVAQLDDAPARLAGQQDRLGLVLPPTTRQLILKLYNSQNGQVALVTTAGTPSEYLTLYTFP